MKPYSEIVRERAKIQKNLEEKAKGGGFMATVARHASVMDQGAWEGAAGVLDFATMGPLQMAIKAALGGDPSFRGAAESAGLIREEREPQTGSERAAATVGEYVGATAVPIPGMRGAAKMLGPAKNAAVPGAMRSTLSPYLSAPGRAASAELVAGTSAGGAAAVAREVAPGNPTAELAAGVVGALAPAGTLGAARAVGRAAGPEVVGTLAGGVAGNVVGGPPVAAIGAVGGGTAGRLAHKAKLGTPEARAVARRAEASSTLRGAVPDPDATRAAIAASDIEDIIPDARPTIAAKSESKGLRTLEADLYRNDPRFAGDIDIRREQNRHAVRRAFSDTEPEGPGNYETRDLIRREVDGQLDALDQQVAEARTTAQSRIAAIEAKSEAGVAAVKRLGAEKISTAERGSVAAREKAQRGMRSADASAVYLSELDTAADRFRVQASANFDGVDPEGVLSLDMRKIRAAAGKIAVETDVVESANIPAVVQIAGTYRAKEPFIRVLALEREVNSQLRAAKMDPTRRGEVRLLNQMKDSITETLDDLVDSPDMSPPVERYREAKRFFREGAKVFREGQAGKVLEPTRTPVPESVVLSKFFLSGKNKGAREAMADFTRTTERMRLDGDVEGAVRAETAMRDYVVADALDAFETASGKVNPARLQTWIRNHEYALDAFPEVRTDLGNVSRAQSLLDAANATAKRTIKEAQTDAGYTTAAARRVEKGGLKAQEQRIGRERKAVENSAARLYARAHPDEAIELALKNTERMRELLVQMQGDVDAVAGLRRSAWGNFRDKSMRGDLGEPSSTLNPKLAVRYIDKYRRSLRILWGERRLRRIEKILDAGNKMLGETPGQTRGRMTDARGDDTVINTVWRMTRARSKGGSVSGFALDFMEGMLEKFPSVGAQDLIEEGILYPDTVGRTLLMRVTPATKKTVAARMQSHLMRMQGFAARATLAEQRDQERATTNRTALP